MEPESRNRRRRRSVRNLRRSSGFYTDSFTAAFEVEELKVNSIDDDLGFAYGSVWVESDRVGTNTDSLETCLSDTAKPLGKDCITANNSNEKRADLLSSHSGCEFSESLFNAGDNLNEHPSLAGGSFGTQCVVSNLLEADLVDVTSLSSCDPGTCVTLHLPVQHLDVDVSPRQPVQHWVVEVSPRQLVRQLDVDVSPGGEPCLQTTGVLSAHISNNVQRNINTDDAYLVHGNPSLSHDDKVYVLKNKRLHENVYHNERIMLKENIQFNNEVVKTDFTDELAKSVVVEKLQDSDNDIETSDEHTAVSLKERQKNDRLNERLDAVKESEFKPKKRKRLSLKKIPQDSTDPGPVDINKLAEIHSDVKIDIAIDSDNNINETFEQVIDTQDLIKTNTYNLNSANASEWVDTTSTWSDNLEITNCVDEVINGKEIDFEKDFFFQDFQPLSREKKSKRSSQSRAKAARRSSRLFQPCEMPLNDLSLEQNLDLELPSSQISKNEIYNSETSSSELVIQSWGFSEIMSESSEDKENFPATNFCKTGQLEELADANSSQYLHSAGTDQFLVKDCTLVEEFANLCMHEKTVTQGRKYSEDSRQAGQGSDGTAPSDTVSVIAPNVYSCTDTDVDKGGILDVYSRADALSACNNLLDSSALQENISNDGKMSFDHVKLTVDYEEQSTDNMEDLQSPLDTAFSTSSADVDMEELLSPDKKPAEHETDADVISDSGKCMKLRRGRKSWDTNQRLHADSRKKNTRRKSKQGNPEDETNKLADLNKAENSFNVLATEHSDNDSEQDAISPGLLNLYRNKNFVAPQPRSWETIKESPKSNHFLFTKQRQKCFLEFENGITRAKLQRRHKKALDVYKRMGAMPSAVSATEFQQKMLDIQLAIDS